eukprot:TRINITY_DN14487_c0_g7_i1.p1 TRINITY_DN14487_c0_g7~~TRINITY_DN14487_c0_g7_i1.p1  ORF type:complete len:778 (+),score=153.39 TRINITY_DN14487_c0_g7_i1:68-2335(+)
MGAACSRPKEGAASAPKGLSKEGAEKLRFLQEVTLFKRLPKEEHPALANCAARVTFAAGDVIIKQGDQGHEFFVIKSGTAKVVVGGNVVAQLSAGDFFGENALLRDEPRTATISAASAIEALKITRDNFRKLGLNTKLEFPKRGAVGGGAMTDAAIKPPSSKTPRERELMLQALKKNTNLSAMVNIDDANANKMIDLMWKDTVEAKTDLIVEGDLNADYFYIVQEGQFEIIKGKKKVSAENAIQASSSLGTIAKGGSFGELALMYVAPRAATITAQVNAVVWVIDRKQFKNILAKAGEAAAQQYIKHLEKVDMLNKLAENEKFEVAKALQELKLSKDEQIFAQGEPGDRFYILIDGVVSVIQDGKEVAKLTATSKAAQIFGEKALMDSAPRNATIKVVSETAMALYLDKQSFEMLVKGAAAAPSPDANKKRFGNIVRKDLRRLGLLGCGGFGAVEMVEHVKTGETYALKCLSKGYVVKSGMQQSVMSEKAVQMLCDSPFVIHLYETFNGDQSLYFLLECALGGELYSTYNKKNLYGREPCAKFYSAGTLFAFEHLHSRKIVYRDLKPENLLLNEAGKVKLTDMGLAKVCVGKTYTTCGTPDYFAPELIASKGHNRAVDWWCLGILTFELLSGAPPFEAASPMLIYQKVQKGIGKVAFPKSISAKAESMIKGLLNNDPNERLPMKKGETQNVKKHEWYAGFDWKAMFELTMNAPYKPVVKNKKDIANFNARPEDMPPQIPYKDTKTGWDKNFATST